jgi:shikimate kinase
MEILYLFFIKKESFKAMKIFLVGMMGCGKTKMGKKLASLLSLDFIDVDEFIELNEQRSVSQLFEDEGEDEFRKLEHQYLEEILKKDQVVVSTGGGLPCFMGNMDMINKEGITIYLEAHPAFLKSRLLHHQSQRPLIASIADVNLEAFLDDMLKQRKSFYQKSQLTLQAKSLKAYDMVEALKKKD